MECFENQAKAPKKMRIKSISLALLTFPIGFAWGPYARGQNSEIKEQISNEVGKAEVKMVTKLNYPKSAEKSEPSLRVEDQQKAKESDESNSIKELTRTEIDKLTAEYEASKNENEKNQAAKKAAESGQLDKCFAILKSKKISFEDALFETCNLYISEPRDEKKIPILEKWLCKLRLKYTENLYLATFEIFKEFLEDKPEIANEKVRELNSRLFNNEILGFNYDSYWNLCSIKHFCLWNGFSRQAFQIAEYLIQDNEINKKYLSDEMYKSKIGLSLADNIPLLLKHLYDQDIDYESFLRACDELLITHPQQVLSALNAKKALLQKDPKNALKSSKIFWRARDLEAFDKQLKPWVDVLNQEAFIFYHQVRNLKSAEPLQKETEALVRLDFAFGSGTGFFVEQPNIIATAAHNFAAQLDEPFNLKIVTASQQEIAPKKIYFSPTADLALILVDYNSKAFLRTDKNEIQAGEKVKIIGFPLTSLQPYFRDLKVLGNLPMLDDILLSWGGLPGISGSPIISSNGVIGIHCGTLSFKANLILTSIEQLQALSDLTTNLSQTNSKKNLWLNPFIKWMEILNSIDSGSLEDYLETDPIKKLLFGEKRSHYRYFQNKKEQVETAEKNLENTSSKIRQIARNPDKTLAEKTVQIKALNVAQEIKDSFEVLYVAADKKQTIKETLQYNPEFAPALKLVADENLFAAVGLKNDKNHDAETVKIKIEKIVNQQAFEDWLEYMEKYFQADPWTIWDYPFYQSTEESLRADVQQYLQLKMNGPILLAYADGDLTVDELESIAQEGNSLAMEMLATQYLKREVKDEKKAFEWFTKLAEQGDADGQSSLGWCYLDGIGVEKDEKKAFEWFTKSAEQGNKDAKAILLKIKNQSATNPQ